MSTMDFKQVQKTLTVSHSTLAHIARGAPLAQTLNCIACDIEEQYPHIAIAILLLEEGNRLRLAAAPTLPPDYRRAIDGMKLDSMLQITADDIEANRFCSSFHHLALQHGLHVCSMIPLRTSADYMAGIFVAYTRKVDQTGETYEQAIAEIAVLASIALQGHAAETSIKKAADALRHSETIMALAIEGSGTGIWDRDIASGFINYSAGWKAILGYADAEISNQIADSYARVHPDDLAYVQAAIQAHFDQKTDSYAVEHRIRCKDGSYKWIASRGKVIKRDAKENPLRMIGTTNDITSMRVMSDKLQQSVDLITSLTNEVPGLVYQYRLLPDGAAFFSYASGGIKDIYELTPEQLADNAALVDQFIHPDDLAQYSTSLAASANSLNPWHLEYRVILPRQGLRWRQADARPRRLQDGSTLWYGFITDITERKRIEIELQGFATIDFLTQLPNRRYFMTRMEEELARIRRVAGARAAVLMCDLDHFKIINDSYGHAVGDLVLKHFAVILRNALRRNDTVGRVGGEEFAVVLSDAGVVEADIFAQRVRSQLAATPLMANDETISVTVSIGIAIMNSTDANIDVTLSRSDKALYRAKEAGRNRIEVDAS